MKSLSMAAFRHQIEHHTREPGRHLALLTARRLPPDAFTLVAVLVTEGQSQPRLVECPLEAGATAFPSLTPHVPQVHTYERAISDFFGLEPEGHPRFKSLILHEAWPASLFPLRGSDATPRAPYTFLEVQGEGVNEIPVGPIHAGIIEPGHFRFSCVGEIIQNLEIRLGYQHRGVEQRLTELPWTHARHLAEAASSDTTVGNAMAHARAIEALCGVEVPPAARWLRTMALEIERVASHLGDLAGICNDIGYLGGASLFARWRGQALGLAERASGSRFMNGYVRPGGVRQRPTTHDRNVMLDELAVLQRAVERDGGLLLENPAALERMESTGRVKPHLARDFGLVGVAGRASGSTYDVRTALVDDTCAGLVVASSMAGDVLARVRVRADELRESLRLIHHVLHLPLEGPLATPLPTRLPAGAAAGLVEAWRGELVHFIVSGGDGHIERYAIKDPSLNNWTGLAIAARHELVFDFPLCNKSFGLSYSGHDL